MGYISRYDLTFLTFVSKKYGWKKFRSFESYSLWLFEEKCKNNNEKYYEHLEEDIKEYADWQKGRKAGDKNA